MTSITNGHETAVVTTAKFSTIAAYVEAVGPYQPFEISEEYSIHCIEIAEQYEQQHYSGESFDVKAIAEAVTFFEEHMRTNRVKELRQFIAVTDYLGNLPARNAAITCLLNYCEQTLTLKCLVKDCWTGIDCWISNEMAENVMEAYLGPCDFDLRLRTPFDTSRQLLGKVV